MLLRFNHQFKLVSDFNHFFKPEVSQNLDILARKDP